MKPTVDYLEKKFDEFNELCFEGSLPKIDIELTTSKHFLGRFCYKVRRFTRKPYDTKIKINRRLDCEESLIEDTLIHEMIHYYIFDKKFKDTSTHGQLFRNMMASINETYKRHITISHKPTEKEMAQLAGEKKKTHVVVVVKFADGKTGVKNLPADEKKIGLFNKRLRTIKEVVFAKYYLSDNTYFNRIPCSVAFRFCIVKEEELAQYLEDAKTILEKK